MHDADSPSEVYELAKNMCGKNIITKASGHDGFLCKGVYVQEKLTVDREVYLTIQLDRRSGCAEIIYCPIGGFELYKLMRRYPQQIERIKIQSLI